MSDQNNHDCTQYEKFKHLIEQVKTLESKVSELFSYVINHDKSIAVIESKLTNISEKVDSVIEKLDALSKKQEYYDRRPREAQDKIAIAVVTGIVMAALGFMANKIMGA